MILDQNQIQELLDIIEGYHLSFIAQNVGIDILSTKDQEFLKNIGFPLEKYKNILTPVDYAFKFGILSTSLNEAVLKNFNFNQLKNYISKGKFIPLTQYEQDVLNSIKYQSFKDIKGLGNRIKQDINGYIIEEDQKKRQKYEKIIRKELVKVVKNRETVKDLVSRIGNKTKDWNRDLGRIADCILHQAFDEGRAISIERNKGRDALVFKDVYPGACNICRKLYTTAGLGTHPKEFKLSELINNGTNIGRKTNEWKAVIGFTHPFCFPEKTEVLTNEGWLFFEDLKGNELFLSVDLKTQNAEWVKSIKYIKEYYKGELIKYQNRDFYLICTPNHNHPIKHYRWINKEKVLLYEMKNNYNFPGTFYFIRNIPNWVGIDKPFIQIGKYKFKTEVFCQFLGWFLSEGNFSKENNEIYISQDKDIHPDNYKEIYNCCINMFGEIQKEFGLAIIKLKQDITFYLKDKDLINYFSQFGYSYEKFIPLEIKELDKKYLKIFLTAYRKGDGSYNEKGNYWDGYHFEDQEIISTSSIKMSSDIGELILKLGYRPSYFIKLPWGKPIWNEKTKTFYQTKRIGYDIAICKKTNFTFSTSIKKEILNYEGYIYDVELEKFNTLFVRQNGKVTLSGNCRCTLHEVPEDYEWNEKTNMYDKLKPWERKIERKTKVKIKIGEEEKYI